MRLDWRIFEELTCELFRLSGFYAELTSRRSEGGIDLILRENYSSVPIKAVQCKSWSVRKIGLKEIRELLASMVNEGIEQGVFVSSNKFSDEARRFANRKNIELMDGSSMLEVIQKIEKANNLDLLSKFKQEGCFTPSCPSCGTKMVVIELPKLGHVIG